MKKPEKKSASKKSTSTKKSVKAVKKESSKTIQTKKQSEKKSPQKLPAKKNSSLKKARQSPDTTTKKNENKALIPSSDAADKLPEQAGSSKEIATKQPDDIDSDALHRGDIPMTVVDHLDEFRSRIIIVLVTIILLTIGAFFVSDYLLQFIMQPFLDSGQKLNIFTLAGGFLLRLKVSVVAALLIGLPLLGFHLWRYIVPAISVGDRVFARLSLIAAALLFYTGVVFVFYIILPMAIPMLLSFIGSDMLSTIGADDYLSFILILGTAMGLLFELPIIIMILTRIGILTPYFLIQKRKYAIVIIWVIAALITPQDILSQVMVAIPMMMLYEISIVISKMMVIRKKRNELRKQGA
ncbi:MAG TPA: twin-arginine translocase subunit TatC [Spirochaetota bacterium]|nr:twin-arginine translocase subunit TatC [Spirochaetota bacterium]HPI88293.1 twin-arginine translocase subunit TatC [Spirochaetota bacterium]HPR47757.1 twin-arginine translocase subunit TatC [Spirochaetota bacterium]